MVNLLNPARRDIEPSVLSEMQLFNLVRKRIAADSPAAHKDVSLFYARTATDREIDFVSECLGNTAIESKYIESGNWNAASRTLGASTWRGVVATKNVLDTRDADGVWAVPTALLAYLVDSADE
jgi:hypothetical protein